MFGLSLSATATCIPEGVLLSQIQLLRSVVSKDEWKYWVLHQVIECPPSQLVELSEILKIGDFSLPPTINVDYNVYWISFTLHSPISRSHSKELNIKHWKSGKGTRVYWVRIYLWVTCLSFSFSFSPLSSRLGRSSSRSWECTLFRSCRVQMTQMTQMKYTDIIWHERIRREKMSIILY